ncbi:MAG: nucleotide exchange factor GrpE [Ruminococcaceae bacterium]|nr:nucleotide exchange factor GrpE [Oscillospiraceae bacterium]
MLKKKKDANAPEVNAEETAATAPEEEMEEEVMTGEPEEIEEEYEEEDPIRAELAEQKERYLRLAAEYDNYRKRTQREKTLIGAESRADCVAALLPVMDNLERALEAQDADAETMRQGVEMVLRQTLQIFGGMDVKAFGAAGDAFDPQLHQCVSTAASEEYDSGCITFVMQKGYMMGDRVIRPAMVQVAE